MSALDLLQLPLDMIIPNAEPIRNGLGLDGPNGVSSLSASVAEMGVMQPIRVMPHATDADRFEIVFGHRRHAAATEAGMSTIPAIVVPRQNRLAYLKMALDENTKRQNMSDRERAEAEAALKAEMETAGGVRTGAGRPPINNATVALLSYADTRAASTQESPRTIENYVAVGQASAAVKDALDDGLLTFAAAADVAGEASDVQAEVVERLRESGVRKANPARTSRLSEVIKSEHKEADHAARDLPPAVRLLQGDCLEILAGLPDAAFDALITDPPYGILSDEWDTFTDDAALWEFTRRWFALAAVKIKPSGRIYVSFSQVRMYGLHAAVNPIAAALGFEFCNTLIWNYRNNITPHDQRRYKFTYEPVLFWNGPAAPKLHMAGGQWGGDGGIHDCDVLVYAQPQTNFNTDCKTHPAQKPLGLMSHLVVTGCAPGGDVLDPFAGSGTTGLACMEAGRNAVLIERDPAYCDAIRARLSSAAPVAA